MRNLVPWLATCAAVIAHSLVFVPVVDYGTDDPIDEPLSVAGMFATGRTELGLGFVAVFALWLILAVWSWAREPGAWWATVAALTVAGVASFLIDLSQYFLIWHGVDSEGRPTGDGYGVEPGIGTAILGLSMTAMLAASVVTLGRLVAARRSSPPKDSRS